VVCSQLDQVVLVPQTVVTQLRADDRTMRLLDILSGPQPISTLLRADDHPCLLEILLPQAFLGEPGAGDNLRLLAHSTDRLRHLVDLLLETAWVEVAGHRGDAHGDLSWNSEHCSVSAKKSTIDIVEGCGKSPGGLSWRERRHLGGSEAVSRASGRTWGQLGSRLLARCPDGRLDAGCFCGLSGGLFTRFSDGSLGGALWWRRLGRTLTGTSLLLLLLQLRLRLRLGRKDVLGKLEKVRVWTMGKAVALELLLAVAVLDLLLSLRRSFYHPLALRMGFDVHLGCTLVVAINECQSFLDQEVAGLTKIMSAILVFGIVVVAPWARIGSVPEDLLATLAVLDVATALTLDGPLDVAGVVTTIGVVEATGVLVAMG